MVSKNKTRSSFFATSLLAGAIAVGVGASTSAIAKDSTNDPGFLIEQLPAGAVIDDPTDPLDDPPTDPNLLAEYRITITKIDDIAGPPSDQSALDTAVLLNEVLTTFGGYDQVAPTEKRSERTSTRHLYQEAADQWKTLMARCAYWRDYADDRTEGWLVFRQDNAERVAALITGSRKRALSTYELSQPVDRGLLPLLQERVEDISLAFAQAAKVRVDTTYRISSRHVKAALNEFLGALENICPRRCERVPPMPEPETNQ